MEDLVILRCCFPLHPHLLPPLLQLHHPMHHQILHGLHHVNELHLCPQGLQHPHLHPLLLGLCSLPCLHHLCPLFLCPLGPPPPPPPALLLPPHTGMAAHPLPSAGPHTAHPQPLASCTLCM